MFQVQFIARKRLNWLLIVWNILTFYAPEIEDRGGGILFLSCLSFCYSITLSFCPPLGNFNLVYNFWTVSARALIFYLSIPCDKTFPWEQLVLPCDLDLGVGPCFVSLNLANNLWTASDRALIFHISIPCDKTFPWVPLFFTLWPWPWILTYFLKTLTLLITFEQWELELLSYCNWAFLVTRFSLEYQDICPCDLGHLWNWPLSGAFVFTNTSC